MFTRYGAPATGEIGDHMTGAGLMAILMAPTSSGLLTMPTAPHLTPGRVVGTITPAILPRCRNSLSLVSICNLAIAK